MRNLLRHLLAIAALPAMVTIVIPLWLARRNGTALALPTTGVQVVVQSVGAYLVVVGVFLFAWSLRRFAGDGDGTLAPWDPPRRLVVHGPYRYVRNPMISGVVFILFGEGLILRSPPHLTWAMIFLVSNAIYIPLFEEPGLRTRFGESYREYCRHVPRLIPRLHAWIQ